MFIFYLLSAFAGYVAGRVGHIFGGHISGPHHWIFGLILAVIGFFLNFYILLAFGIGVFISDLKDCLEFKFWGVDDVKVKRFWGID